MECTKGAPTLEECTKNIVEGQLKDCRPGGRLLIGIPGIRGRVKRALAVRFSIRTISEQVDDLFACSRISGNLQASSLIDSRAES